MKRRNFLKGAAALPAAGVATAFAATGWDLGESESWTAYYESNPNKYSWQQYSRGFVVDNVEDFRVKALAKAMKETKERCAAQVFNNWYD